MLGSSLLELMAQMQLTEQLVAWLALATDWHTTA
jgi:hypothetical protein